VQLYRRKEAATARSEMRKELVELLETEAVTVEEVTALAQDAAGRNNLSEPDAAVCVSVCLCPCVSVSLCVCEPVSLHSC
jgi:hypothetical protein